ncbi:MAG: HEAT repeat domain-containing protein, partial [Planctomycetota bacterium]
MKIVPSLASAIAFMALTVLPVSAQEPGDEELEAAIRLLKELRPEKMKALTPAEWPELQKKLKKAFDDLKKSGDRGIARIEKELAQIEKDGGKDDVFSIVAASAIFQIGGVDTAEKVAKILKSVDPGANFQSLFILCADMARCRDERVLPAMLPLLRMDPAKHAASLGGHAMVVGWPLVLDFTFGIFGPKCAPHLAKILESTSDPKERNSCMYLLERFHFLAALPKVREFAKTAKAEVKAEAIFILGKFAHPDDRAFIESLIKDEDLIVRKIAIAALWEMCDPESSKCLAPLLKDEDQGIRISASIALPRLCQPDGILACAETLKTGTDEKAKKWIRMFWGDYGKNAMDMGLATIGVTIEEVKEADEGRRKEIAEAYWAARDKRFTLKPDDRTLTREDLEKALSEWTGKRSIMGGNFSWVEHRHILSVAQESDLDRFSTLRGVLLERMSDECLHEVRLLDQ